MEKSGVKHPSPGTGKYAVTRETGGEEFLVEPNFSLRYI
jgi:hypothetical protein